MTDNQLHEKRLVTIELLLMQLQHDVEQLNKALLAQQVEMESVKRAMDRLSAAEEDIMDEPRPLEEERPPHY